MCGGQLFPNRFALNFKVLADIFILKISALLNVSHIYYFFCEISEFCLDFTVAPRMRCVD